MRLTLIIILSLMLWACNEAKAPNPWGLSEEEETSELILVNGIVLPEDEYDEEIKLLQANTNIKRKIYSPWHNRAKGIISPYDKLFQRYSKRSGWDWRLIAAQCYQESCFDPKAVSRAGACGLMQIMPSTADHLGLRRSEIYDPEKNIAASAKYVAELTRMFSDISNKTERIKFVLACYKGGPQHVRNAMKKAQAAGRNPKKWEDVSPYCYAETQGYVTSILKRWQKYRT